MRADTCFFVLVLVALHGCRCLAQATPSETPISAPVAPPAKPIWRWGDPDGQPSQPWHTDGDVQARLQDEARAAAQEAVGLTLPGTIEIGILPAWAFFFVQMEVGAKDGSLFIDTSVSRAMEMLSFVPRDEAKPKTVSDDWRGDPASAAYYAGGIYSPKHVRRLIFVKPDRTEQQVAAILRHEFVHALQDEAYPFGTWLNFEGITADEKWARQAVEEGYAVLVAGASDADDLAASVDVQDWTSRHILLIYGAGRGLVDRVKPRAEGHRELLDLVFNTPPATTREVLHPDLYEQHLETRTPPELPAPGDYVQLCDVLASGLSAAAQPVAWRSRLGEHALQSVLIELGAPADEATVAAAAWRNDTVTNHGNWRHPTSTSWVVGLASADDSAALASRLRALVAARGANLVETSITDVEPTGPAHASLDGSRLPQVVIARLGTAVALVVGEGLESLLDPPSDH